ncbi:MAG: hypothetical protein EU548_07220 [Promethearchaeota archaeon]|nr:MAG: hypothetical protein EU548_07220 [Candidatus Lokiarchaeota archaeon]
MKRKQLIFGIIITIIGLSSISVTAMATPTSPTDDLTPNASLITSKMYSGNGNNLNLGRLRKGDIIAVSGVKWGDGALPGHYTHIAIYVGNGLIVEAMPGGVRYAYAYIVHGASDAAIIRVRASSSVKRAAANFCKRKVGRPYDYIWLTYYGGKQVYGYRYYCSELAWAAYKHAAGINIDRHPGWSWKYGYNVAPQEIVDDGNTWMVHHSY